MNNRFCRWAYYLIVFCFVISLAFDVKFYLDNKILKLLLSEHLEVDKRQVEQITSDLHESFKQGDLNLSNELNLTKE